MADSTNGSSNGPRQTITIPTRLIFAAVTVTPPETKRSIRSILLAFELYPAWDPSRLLKTLSAPELINPLENTRFISFTALYPAVPGNVVVGKEFTIEAIFVTASRVPSKKVICLSFHGSVVTGQEGTGGRPPLALFLFITVVNEPKLLT